MLHESLIEQARALQDEMTALRRAIHAEPELGLHTPLTRDKIRAALADLPLTWREGGSTTGLVATLQGGAGPGRSVLLRGDMDALPMPEETGLDFASTIPGTMHACGHDAHVAMLAGAVRLLCDRRDSLKGEVRFMFQPGEEGYHGARYMIDDGLIGGGADGTPLPDAAFALHVMPNARHGQIAGRAGPLMAAADKFDVIVKGRGGHASMPHFSADPLPVAAEIVLALQSAVTRQFDAHDPVVCTVSKIAGGTAHNVIPDTVSLLGTLRSLSPRHRAALHAMVERVATGIAQAHGMQAETTITEGFPVTVCDPRAAALGAETTAALFGDGVWHALARPIMGAEDFSYVLEKVPGAMFFLGVAAEGSDWNLCEGIHSTRMVLDEAALPRGAALLAGLAERFLAAGFA
ncbi:M20 family metallopeptidase [Novosphingobium aquiterrae]|uniref:M20 family metallopeptidase n=1 Tax=Novosphingobium aquiterrae TaxID=624388 RepID=A0ABV6PJ97_9SPHN